MKDNFSKQASVYAQFRPDYPPALVNHILAFVKERTCAWDCATGNGQLAAQLASYFDSVEATDISKNQLAHAVLKSNIHYSCQSAHQALFPANYFDLITVAQAIHWFDFNLFYAEAYRTLKNDGIFAAIGYPLMRFNDGTDDIVDNLYHKVLKDYWDKERVLVDTFYESIPFPFKEYDFPDYFTTVKWNKQQLIGYLNSWSAVQHYITKNNKNPVLLMLNAIDKAWGNDIYKEVVFRFFTRIGCKADDKIL